MKKSTRNRQFRLFTGMPAGAALLSLALVLSACPNTTGPDKSEDLNKTELEASITEAQNAKTGVAASAQNGADVPVGTYWVTTVQMTTFTNAIGEAETARDSATNQAALDSAKTALDDAIQTFNAAKRNGTGAPVNKSALMAKIAEAEAARAGVQQAAGAGEVAQGAKWVTAAVWNTFDAAITAAKTAQTSAVQSTVDAAVGTLGTAIGVFNSAKQDGSKTSGFSAEELTALITQASAAKEGVSVSTQNGDDISPAAYWASQSDLNALTTAIGNAQAAGNRDSLYLALAQALTAFTGAKKTGTVPEKTALTAAIQSANQAKEGVKQAASKAQAPQGSKWATAAQFSPLNTAYAAAQDAVSNANVTKNAVDTAASALNSAVGTFNSAVNSNGPGGDGSQQPEVTTLTENTWADGKNIPEGVIDQWFTFTATASKQYIHFESGTLTEVSVQVDDGAGNYLGNASLYGSTSASFSVTIGKVYYIRVIQYISGSYKIGFTRSIIPPSVVPAVLTADTWASGDLSANGAQWFKFTATESKQFIHFEPGTLPSAYVQVYDSKSNAAGDVEMLYGSTHANRSVEIGQVYYIKVTMGSISGSYRIAFNTVISPPGAAELTENTWEDGTLSANGVQWFKFTATASKQFMHFEPGTLIGVKVYLHDSEGNAVEEGVELTRYSTDYYTGYSVTIGEVYCFMVTPSQSSFSGSYKIGFGSIIPPGVVPAALTADTWKDGTFAEGEREQWFKFTATADTQFMHFEPGTLRSVRVQVYDSVGNAAGYGASLSASTPANRSVEIGQVYYFKVTPNDSSYMSGSYRIAFNTVITPPGAAPAVTLNADTWASGDLPENGVQWFKFTATANTQFIHLNPGTLRFVQVLVYDSTVTPVEPQVTEPTSPGYTRYDVTSGQVYYIQVKPNGSSNSGSYRIAFNADIIPPFTQLTADTWENGDLPTNGAQWFKFTATAPTQFIHFEPGTLTSVWVQVYDSERNEVGTITKLEVSPSTYARSTSSSVTIGRVYYIQVKPYNISNSGSYRIAFNTVITPPGAAPAVTLTADTWAAGDLPANGVQWFKFTAAANTQFMHFEPGTLTSVSVRVYNSAVNEVGEGVQFSSSSHDYYTSRDVTSGQVYYIQVRPYDSYSSSSGSYRIGFTTSIAPPPGATELTADTWAAGDLPENGEQWFKFTATASRQYIHFEPGTLTEVSVRVYASAGTAVDNGAFLSASTRYTSHDVTSGYVYYIKVTPSSGGNYRIAFNTGETAPSGGGS